MATEKTSQQEQHGRLTMKATSLEVFKGFFDGCGSW